MISANSLSGQFFARERRPIYAEPGPAPWKTTVMGSPVFVLNASRLSGDTNTDRLTLEPSLLVISSERIKSRLLQELGLTDLWQGRIELLIDANRPSSEIPRLTSVRNPDVWSYQLLLPKSIAASSLLRAVVGALLVEMANRGAGPHAAELPAWLVDGMTSHLQASSLPTLLLQPGTELPGYPMTIEGQGGIHRWLSQREPLTFQQLSWPNAPANDDDKAFYDACSQLFVEELLGLRDGRACLSRMILQLGQDLNWQTAFLRAFHGRFDRLVDVEKWWSVTCVDFQESQIGQPSSAPEAWKRLQQTLDIPVSVRLDPSILPSEARITLQDALKTWDNDTVKATILRAISQLEVEVYRSPAELRPIIASYLSVLTQYTQNLQDLQHKGDTVRNLPAQMDLLKNATIHQLDLLDTERDGMRAKVMLSENQPAPRSRR